MPITGKFRQLTRLVSDADGYICDIYCIFLEIRSKSLRIRRASPLAGLTTPSLALGLHLCTFVFSCP